MITRRTFVALAGAGALSQALAACQPLYGTTRNGASLKQVMASVNIAEIPGRVGQRLRNELIYGTTGGGYAQDTRYRLEIAIREWIVDLLVVRTGDAQGQIYNLEAAFKLMNVANSEVVLAGKSTSRAAYDRFEEQFSNVRARVDAENRAARMVADDIKTRIAAVLATA